MIRKLLLAGLALPVVTVAAQAAPVPTVVNTAPGTTYNTAALTGFTTFSADMVGSLVTITYNGGATNQVAWTSTGAFGSGWSLTLSGDSFGGPWTFANTGNQVITGLNFNGVPGNTTFDIGGAGDSPGSGGGIQFGSADGPAGLTINALYSNRLTVGGTFYGDEYTNLFLAFGGTGFTGGSSLTFQADTDNASAQGGGITPGVPEPATWAMMIIGFGAMGSVMRRRQSANVRVRYA